MLFLARTACLQLVRLERLRRLAFTNFDAPPRRGRSSMNCVFSSFSQLFRLSTGPNSSFLSNATRIA